jgi:hypothetical protein
MLSPEIFEVMFQLYRNFRQVNLKSEAHFVLVLLSLPLLSEHRQNAGVTGRLKTFTRLEFLLAALRRETQLQGDLCDVLGILKVGLVHRQLAILALLCLEYKVASLLGVTHYENGQTILSV